MTSRTAVWDVGRDVTDFGVEGHLVELDVARDEGGEGVISTPSDLKGSRESMCRGQLRSKEGEERRGLGRKERREGEEGRSRSSQKRGGTNMLSWMDLETSLTHDDGSRLNKLPCRPRRERRSVSERRRGGKIRGGRR